MRVLAAAIEVSFGFVADQVAAQRRRAPSIGRGIIGNQRAALISPMSRFDHCDLDGHLLALLVAVSEEGSMTAAAARLGVTQSAVSHGLDKLRTIVGDPLFLRSGRGICATARAEALLPRARALLESMRGFVTDGGFDPARFVGRVTLAANDLQRELLLPAVLRSLREQAPGLVLRIIPSGVPTAEMLRDGRCQALISPRPPDAGDLVQKRLFEDRYVVYYDPAIRAAPADLAEYLAADHVTVAYDPQRMLDIDQALAERGVQRRFVVTVPGMAALAAFVRGSPRLATAPALLRGPLMQGLAHAEPPLPCPTLPMFLVWHARHQADALHAWLRRTIEDAVAPALASAR
jgi:DNA-binding transcriptional LysR family regulator